MTYGSYMFIYFGEHQATLVKNTVPNGWQLGCQIPSLSDVLEMPDAENSLTEVGVPLPITVRRIGKTSSPVWFQYFP